MLHVVVRLLNHFYGLHLSDHLKCLHSFVMQVKVVDWMKGQTCGLCGKADGEVRQEYRTPNGRVTKSAVSYAHSWILPAQSCRDTSGETQQLY